MVLILLLENAASMYFSLAKIVEYKSHFVINISQLYPSSSPTNLKINCIC